MSMELLRLGLQFFAGETKEEEDEEEGVVVPGVTESTTPAYTMPKNTVDAPVAQDFDTWYKANGGMDEAGYYAKYDLDPDRDYQNTVNTLNYDYQTSMATYGEQAEKMYQMGLQNSGVSDIFQANAFSSYLGNMNQAAANRITARKRNKAAFNDYVANMRAQHGQYETGIKTEYDTKLNSALTYAMSKYNGYNLQDVIDALGVSGYYTDIVDEVGKRLSGMDATSLQAATETVLAQDIINNISGFTGSDNDLAAAKSMYSGMYGDDVIEKAFDRAKTIYQNSAVGQEQIVKNLVSSGQASFDPNYEGGMDTFIKNVWGIETDRNAVDAEGKSLFDESAYNRAVKAWEQMKTDFDNKVLEATEKAKAIWGGAVGAEGVPETARVINDLINEGYSEAVAKAAVDAAGFTSGNAEYYTRTRAEELYAEAYSIMFGGGNIDLSKYGSADDFAKAVKSKVADKLEKYALVGDKLDEIAKAKWQEAYDATIWKGVEYIRNNIKTMGKSTIDDYLKSSPNNFTDDMVNAAWDKYNGTEEGENFTELQNQTTVDELVTKWTDSFDPTMSKADFVNKMITKDGKTDESQRANAEAAWDVMKGAYDEHIGKLDTFAAGLWLELGEVYTGSNEEKSTIDNYLQSNGIIDPKDIEYIRGKIEEKKTQKAEDIKEDTLTGITETPNDEVSYSGLLQAIKDNGDDPDVIKASSVKYKDAVMNALDSPENLANAYKLVPGMDNTTWDGLDYAGKLDALLNGIGEAHKAGTMMDKEYHSVIESWIDNEIRASNDISGFVSIVDKLKEYKNAGYLSEDYYNAFYGKMAAAISPDEFKIYLRATKAGPQYWFSFKSGDDSIKIQLSQSKKKSSEFTNGIDIDGGKMYIDGGTLYLQYGNVVYTYGSSTGKIDNKKTDSTVSGEIFRLISTAVSNTFITVSGSSENGGTKGKGNTQGGRTGEFAVANK